MRTLPLFLANLVANGVSSYCLFRLVLHRMCGYHLSRVALRRVITCCVIALTAALALLFSEFAFVVSVTMFGLLVQALWGGSIIAGFAIWWRVVRPAKD